MLERDPFKDVRSSVQTPERTNSKKTMSRHIIIKPEKTKDREGNLARESQSTTHRGQIQMTTDFSSEAGGQKTAELHVQSSEMKALSTRIPPPAKTSFSNKNETGALK